MHVGSFMVGSLVTGTGFLVIHRNLSHRSRLSSQSWPLADTVQKEIDNILKEARESDASKALPPPPMINIDPAKEVW